ncbi:PhzF family phenazine biosynthesis protein [Clostridium polynesiense]|uniref:PhzF family phenazine biosynthesis protein n=1 Tax=Clostridium polynesiense TaxID=1325933 RepID=UPI00058EBB5D|nr:PhzF family phenazine biosynthesis protein [Clostridium polynesiense]
MKYYIVDSFTDTVFRGNPAGVCVLNEWIDNKAMKNIACENNLSETAFVVKSSNHYELKWFTPTEEVDLCGHATLGAAFVISNFIDIGALYMEFHTLSGILKVERKNDTYILNLPVRKTEKVHIPENIGNILGVEPKEAYLSQDYVFILENEEQVKRLSPNIKEIKNIADVTGVIVTSRGKEVDFVSRCFFPKQGIDEDPVTGSAHCTLIPLWYEKLHKNKMTAKQLSKRGGLLYCEFLEERVLISGKAVLYLKGEILP